MSSSPFGKSPHWDRFEAGLEQRFGLSMRDVFLAAEETSEASPSRREIIQSAFAADPIDVAAIELEWEEMKQTFLDQMGSTSEGVLDDALLKKTEWLFSETSAALLGIHGTLFQLVDGLTQVSSESPAGLRATLSTYLPEACDASARLEALRKSLAHGTDVEQALGVALADEMAVCSHATNVAIDSCRDFLRSPTQKRLSLTDLASQVTAMTKPVCQKIVFLDRLSRKSANASNWARSLDDIVDAAVRTHSSAQSAKYSPMIKRVFQTSVFPVERVVTRWCATGCLPNSSMTNVDFLVLVQDVESNADLLTLEGSKIGLDLARLPKIFQPIAPQLLHMGLIASKLGERWTLEHLKPLPLFTQCDPVRPDKFIEDFKQSHDEVSRMALRASLAQADVCCEALTRILGLSGVFDCILDALLDVVSDAVQRQLRKQPHLVDADDLLFDVAATECEQVAASVGTTALKRHLAEADCGSVSDLFAAVRLHIDEALEPASPVEPFQRVLERGSPARTLLVVQNAVVVTACRLQLIVTPNQSLDLFVRSEIQTDIRLIFRALLNLHATRRLVDFATCLVSKEGRSLPIAEATSLRPPQLVAFRVAQELGFFEALWMDSILAEFCACRSLLKEARREGSAVHLVDLREAFSSLTGNIRVELTLPASLESLEVHLDACRGIALHVGCLVTHVSTVHFLRSAFSKQELEEDSSARWEFLQQFDGPDSDALLRLEETMTAWRSVGCEEDDEAMEDDDHA